MTPILFSSLALVFIFRFVGAAHALDASSASYAAGVVTFLNGGGTQASVNNTVAQSAIGEGFLNAAGTASPNFQLRLGLLHLLGDGVIVLPPGPAIVISDLTARGEVLGSLITERAWQRDNDPYFSWVVNAELSQFVEGFSVSLDTAPDLTVDAGDAVYQFEDDSIPSGKHPFYVLAFTTKWGWMEGNILSFELWVDRQAPFVDQTTPQGGSLLASAYAQVSCLIFDVDSGVDLTRTILMINNSAVTYSYDEPTQLLSYLPSAPHRNGINSVIAKVYDQAGNYTTKGWEFVVDTLPPEASVVINGGAAYTHSAYVSLAISARDEVSGIGALYISNDGVFDTELSQPFGYAPVIADWLLREPDVDGMKTVYLKLKDNAGNMSAAYTARITLKRLTPDTRIISGPESMTEETSADLRFEASMSGCRFNYKLDDAAWSGWADLPAVHFSGLAPGNHYFTVKSGYDLNDDSEISQDEEDATPAQWVWTVKPEGYLEKIRRKILFWRR